MNGPLKCAAVLATTLLMIVAASPLAHAQFPFPPAPRPQQPGQPAQPGPAPQPAPQGDPRADQIKSDLEKAGLRVLGVEFKPAQGNNLAGWFVITAANYAQPSFNNLLNQGFTVWGATFRAIARDDPETVMFGGQQWSKYMMILITRLKHVTTLASGMSAAGNDQDKQRVYEAFLATLAFRVYDLERQQFADEKDFVNKNFTR